ncbi:haloacid dehalogenase [Psychromonas marina]|uniref:Haloacid dehalogenase n=1 Tax=Psychromonas marina TaxID=88364 RepID=A0ABQ6E2I9_9GAMM|nr:HAD family hydrolase [Psychromonas marina]GLS91581.1 haloacid dehalogenase [Psychromonas marina]
MTNNDLYIFDLDETLLNGDSAMLWHQFLLREGIIQDDNFLAEDERLMMLYSQGQLDMQQYLDFCIPPLTSKTIEEIYVLVEQFIESDINPRIFPQAKQLIKQLQQQGKAIIIISATVNFLVSKIALSLNINQHLAIDLETNNNAYSPKIKGVATYQQGKVIRLKAWLAIQATQYQTLHFYTDSINDLSLCEYADIINVVNPCSMLASKARQNNWQHLHWI